MEERQVILFFVRYTAVAGVTIRDTGPAQYDTGIKNSSLSLIPALAHFNRT
ncbi:MAG: hypothetical protein WC626_07870 [Methanoregula sp.]